MPSERISRRSHPAVRRLRALQRGERGDRVVIEGVRVVREAVASIELVEAMISPRLERQDDGRALADALRSRRIPLHEVTDAVLAAVSSIRTHQGVLVVGRLAPTDLVELLRPQRRPRLVLACGIQEPGNIGALVRTAEALGFDGLIRVGGADPFASRAIRAASGSAFRLPIAIADDERSLVAALRSAGYRVVATVASGGRPVAPELLRPPLAIALGGEGSGLPAVIQAASTERIEIPVRAPVESLNVAAAAAIVLWLAGAAPASGS